MARRDGGGMSRGDQKRRTRDALLRAGVKELSTRGLDAPSLDDICARAGFTRGAFYVHFPDREAFLVAVMEHLLGMFLETIATTADPAHDLDRTVMRFVEVADAAASPPRGRGRDGVPFHQLLDGCRRSPAVRARFLFLAEEAMQRLAEAAGAAQGAGNLRRDVGPDRVASLLLVLALGVLASVESGLPLPARELGATILALLRPAPAPRREGRDR